MKNFDQPGKVLELTAPAAVSSGDGVLVGKLFCVATVDIASGEKGNMAHEGVFTLPKNNATAMSEGDAVDWDDTAKEMVATTTGDLHAGIVVKEELAAATTVKVKLTPAAS